jgi:hypothetical protein
VVEKAAITIKSLGTGSKRTVGTSVAGTRSAVALVPGQYAAGITAQDYHQKRIERKFAPSHNKGSVKEF